MTRALILAVALLVGACAQRDGGAEGVYVSGGAGANYRPASPLR